MAAIFLANSLKVVSEALLQRDFRFKAIAISNVGAYLFGFGVIGIVLAVAGFGVWSLVWANIANSIIRCVALCLSCRHSWRMRPRIAALLDLWGSGAGFALGRLGNFLAIQGDNVIVAKFLGASAVGLYSRAYQLLTLPVQVFGHALERVLFPALADLHRREESLNKTYLRALQGIALVTLPSSALVILLAPEIILGLFGDAWRASVPVIRILALAMFFRIAYTASDAVAKGVGAVYSRAWRQWFYAGAVIAGAAVGSTWGLRGVAWGVLIAILVNFALSTHLAVQKMRCSWFSVGGALAPGLLLILPTLAVGVWSSSLMRDLSWPPLFICLLSFGACLLACVATISLLPRHFDVINDVLALVKRR